MHTHTHTNTNTHAHTHACMHIRTHTYFNKKKIFWGLGKLKPNIYQTFAPAINDFTAFLHQTVVTVHLSGPFVCFDTHSTPKPFRVPAPASKVCPFPLALPASTLTQLTTKRNLLQYLCKLRLFLRKRVAKTNTTAVYDFMKQARSNPKDF